MRIGLGIIGIVVLFFAAVLFRGCLPARTMHFITDTEGRIVIYHGLNVSNYAKTAPDFLSWHTREDFARMKTWGFNLVRYLVFWEAIEPTDGEFDENYIEKTLERLKWMEEQGIDVVLDIHQDLYCRKFTGNGFPEWTVDTGGHEFTPAQPWNINYLDPAVLHAYDHFWRSEALKDRYVRMVEHLLQSVDNQNNVIGVEIMNEPFPWTGLGFEKKALAGLYEKIQTMRQRNNFRIPFLFEPVIYTSAGFRSRLTFAPETGSVYSVHYYDPLCHEGKPYKWFGRQLMPYAMRVKVQEAERFGTPMLVTEFGIAPSTEGYGEYLRDFLDLANHYAFGWTYYSYDKCSHESFGILDENGNRSPILDYLIQVYPQRIAGTNPIFGIHDKTFDLAYDPINTTAPTLVFVPQSLMIKQLVLNGEEIPFDTSSSYITHPNNGATTRQTIHLEWE
ncbi:MAG TPA: cellulase family glycosylhydrolase [Candidatus Hydrogenedentes bacterium]|mgnify:CR=1 FL=1|nr:cellulase family glycosylhydrolase [Candidatus Hydrogenedentota bacterium]